MTEKLNEEYYVCPRVADLPYGPAKHEAIKGECSICYAPIYMMPYAPSHIPKVCMQCTRELVKQLPPGEEVVIASGREAINKPVMH